ncbi:MAG TPA: fluoride efflux transporter CrcB [Gemmatimonadaceae bacterium]
MMTRQDLALVGGVALGGAIGSVARYLLGTFVQGRAGPSFPLGTLLINIVGSFLIGVILEMALDASAMSPLARLFLATGFCGGFTTFSTFSYETARLVEEGEATRAVVYVMLSVGVSLTATLLGFMLVRRLLGARGP